MSQTVMSIGAFCFGATIGFITYRTLIRSAKAQIGDLTIVISTVGGAAVTGLFNSGHGDLFGWYAIGLFLGLAAYLMLFMALNGRKMTAQVLAAPDIPEGQPGQPSTPAQSGLPRRLLAVAETVPANEVLSSHVA
jgi:hypothetical protein